MGRIYPGLLLTLDAGYILPHHLAMTMHDQLLKDIEAYLRKSRMGAHSFGERACGDKHVVRRLRSGFTITLKKADRIKAFMALDDHGRASAA